MIFGAHAELYNIVSVSDLWRNFLIDQIIRARWWPVPFDAVPRDDAHEAQVEWLYDWWKWIGIWITQNRPEEVPASWDRPRAGE